MDPREPSTFERLVGLLTPMNEAQLARILSYAQGQVSPVFAEVDPDSALVTRAFADEFESRLRAHHALQSKPLGRVPFEDAFRAACEAAGRQLGPKLGATASYIDLSVDGQNFALKTTAAKDVRADYAHISKLCEASWIQDVRGAADRQFKTKALFESYLGVTDRIVQLRVLPDPDAWVYQLLEIPMHLFEPILKLGRDSFVADGPSIPVRDQDGECLTLKLDRSDAKITIARIPVQRCLVHATWRLPK